MAKLSVQLEMACRSGIAAVQRDRDHDLQLGYQLAIWAAIGPPPGLDTPARITSKRWIYLHALAVRRILSVWHAACPTRNDPEVLLSKADSFFMDRFDRSAIEQLVYRDRERILSRGQLGYFQWLVLWASMSVLESCLVAFTRPTEFYPRLINYEIQNRDLDCNDWDASYAASVVASRGRAWEPASDAQARQRFWFWWIEEAVPSAYEAFS